MAAESIDCAAFCAAVQPYVISWPEGEIRPLCDRSSRRNWATVVRLGELYILAWVSAESHGQVMEQIMAFNFRQLGPKIFAGYEMGPASKARVIPTITMRINGGGVINDQLACDGLRRAAREIKRWPTEMVFNDTWQFAQAAARCVMEFFAPAWVCRSVQFGTKIVQSPDGTPF